MYIIYIIILCSHDETRIYRSERLLCGDISVMFHSYTTYVLYLPKNPITLLHLDYWRNILVLCVLTLELVNPLETPQAYNCILSRCAHVVTLYYIDDNHTIIRLPHHGNNFWLKRAYHCLHTFLRTKKINK